MICRLTEQEIRDENNFGIVLVFIGGDIGNFVYICSMSRVAIIGGGAAGFFLAVNLKEMAQDADITIFERGKKVLSKVEISGGGRCNCTNTFEGVADLSSVYPRGHRLMKRLFHEFDYNNAYEWFENHGVELIRQDDHCVFPKAQDSHAIINCFTEACRRSGIKILTGKAVDSMKDLAGFDVVCVTTGGSPTGKGYEWLREMGHEIVEPVPSLFTLSIGDKKLHDLMGIVAENAIVQIPSTKIRAQGALLITHWGVSGPAILRLSSHGARILHDSGYKGQIVVNWVGESEDKVRQEVEAVCRTHRQRQIVNTPLFGLSQRLWAYLIDKAVADSGEKRWCDVGRKDMNRLVSTIISDNLNVTGRAQFKDEFVTCGGVSLRCVNPSTMESRVQKGLFFAGEVLDIDGVTGGFNFQAAWTTAFVAARGIALLLSQK